MGGKVKHARLNGDAETNVSLTEGVGNKSAGKKGRKGKSSRGELVSKQPKVSEKAVKGEDANSKKRVGDKRTEKKSKRGKSVPMELSSTQSTGADSEDKGEVGKKTEGAKEASKGDVPQKEDKLTGHGEEEDAEQDAVEMDDKVGSQGGSEAEGDEGAEKENSEASGAERATIKAVEDEEGERFAKLEGIGEGWEDSDEEGALETVAVGLLPGQVISDARNDEAGVDRKLEEVGIFCGEDALPFRESLAVTMPLKEKLGDKLAVDDLKRERIFAELATKAVHEGLERLRAEKIKFRRPGDYFAQMVKSDTHMKKVKDKLLYVKGRIEGAEKRRNNREIAKNRKKVRATQMEKEQEKKRKAKEEIEAVSRLRKQRLRDREEDGAEGEEKEDEFPIDLLEIEQLDEENRFRPQKEIADGKRKAWSAKREVADNRKDCKFEGKREKGKSNASGPSGGRVKKAKQGQRGKKKRLGKSRRAAAKTKAV